MAPRDDPEITSISIWYDGCNSTQQDFISHAWDDAINMAKAISGIDYDHDPAAIEYFAEIEHQSLVLEGERLLWKRQ